ncbi:MAG: DUF1588 domain-containing protein [Candidatus Hinthialibacter antarcticus]|nr:DUF1588 domain-containing protein [Candidatus Hinthialibacter antarcticus]
MQEVNLIANNALRLVVVFILLLFTRPSVCDEFDFEKLHEVFSTHCYICHGEGDPAAGLNLEQYDSLEKVLDDLHVWTSVISRVKAGEMPPKNSLPLDEDQQTQIVDWLQNTIQDSLCGDGIDPGPHSVRRLNRNEYSATIRDLLGIHFDSGSSLPADGSGGEGFDNAAETLFLSPVHAERYLESAKEALEYAAKEPNSREQIFIAKPNEVTSAFEAGKMTIHRFAFRAFRRPVTEHELDRYMTLFQTMYQRNQSYESAVFYAMQAILISPHFLFLVEQPNQSEMVRPVSDYELACRLSYFLWSSMPDDELFDLAAEKQLHKRDVLKQQIKRMLNEPKQEEFKKRSYINFEDRKLYEFANNFVSQWLGTRELGVSSRPDQNTFSNYNEILESAMKYEPVYVFQELLANDLSLLNLIDSDFTFASRQLAQHYEIQKQVNVPNQQLTRVELPPKSHRGGIITMAGVLTVSSYPHRTSPVLRGKWIMETVLGTPPPPPPPDIPELPENHSDEKPKTLRERLEIHRANPACASCHDRIDPLGFGLDNFDAIGRWRTKDANQKIDASGQLPNGDQFNGPDELKQILLERKDDFVRHLTAKMLGYALGRGLIMEDYCTVDRIVEELKRNDYKAQTLLWEIIQSVPFRYHKAKEAPAQQVGMASNKNN